MRRLSCLSRTLRLRRFEVVCGEGGVQSAGRCVMGTLDMLGSKFLSILILMGIWSDSAHFGKVGRWGRVGGI
jgi:hypothetical protein